MWTIFLVVSMTFAMKSETISEETRIQENSARRKDNVCVICLGHFKKSTSTKCDHEFCTACLREYFMKSTEKWRVQCPICKNPCLFRDLFPDNCTKCHNQFRKAINPAKPQGAEASPSRNWRLKEKNSDPQQFRVITFQCGCGIHKNCEKCMKEHFKNTLTLQCAMGCGQKIQWNDIFPKEPHPNEQQIKKRKMIAKCKLFQKGLWSIAVLAYFVNAYLYFAKEVILLAAILYFISKILFAFIPTRFAQQAFNLLMIGDPLMIGERLNNTMYLVVFAFFLLFYLFGNASTFAMSFVISSVILMAAILLWDLDEYNYIYLISVTFIPGTFNFSAIRN